MKNKFDLVVVGGGVLGVCICYWLSSLTDRRIALVDKELSTAVHTSSRNTGVVHRPFYLNPEKKRIFARAAQKSYYLWADLAKTFDLPWSQVGTLEVAIDDSQVDSLHQYERWALANGMGREEIEVLDSHRVSELEPRVRCAGAIFSKRDTAVDYGVMTRAVFKLAIENGITFLSGLRLKKLAVDAGRIRLELSGTDGGLEEVFSDFVINAAGGGAIDIAHEMGVARQYTDLHFRGEYWVVNSQFGSSVKQNVYSVAKHKEFPFLDPHFIVRANGKREVGPNAVLVSGPTAYSGLSTSTSELVRKIFERPNYPKLRLFTNRQFLSLVWQEWRSSISKEQMCERVKQFIPSLDVKYLESKGLAGVRSSVIDENGFVPEALVIEESRSLHILNFNSPGATGAPAFSAFVVRKLLDSGHVRRDKSTSEITSGVFKKWNFDLASDL